MRFASENYILQLKQIHLEDKNWGNSASKWLDRIINFSKDYNFKTILDYGCGKQSLKPLLVQNNFEYIGYDIAFDNHNLKQKADLVIVLDMLEHIEPEFLDNVFQDIKNYTQKFVFFVISTRKAAKLLPDGRNSHLIIQSSNWWQNKIEEYFSTKYTSNNGDNFLYFGSQI